MKNPPHSAVQNSAHLPSWGHVCWWRPYCVPAASPSTQKPARWLRSERDTEQGCGDLLAPGRFSQTWLFSRLELLSGWRVQLVPINQINPLGAKDSAPRSNMGFFPPHPAILCDPSWVHPIRLNSDPVSLEMASDPTDPTGCASSPLALHPISHLCTGDSPFWGSHWLVCACVSVPVCVRTSFPSGGCSCFARLV